MDSIRLIRSAVTKSETVKRTLALFVLQGVALVLSFAVQVTVSRSAGIETYGVFVFVISCMNLLVISSKFGFDTTVLRYASEYSAIGARSLYRKLLRFTRGFTFITSVATMVVTALVVGVLYRFGTLTKELAVCLLIGVLFVPFDAQKLINESILRAFRRPVLAAVISWLGRPALLLGSILAGAYILQLEISSVMAVGLYGVTLGIISLALWCFVPICSPPAEADEEPADSHQEWTSSSASFLLSNGIRVAMRHTDVIMVGCLLGMTEAGIYGAASRISGFIAFGLTASNTAFSPLISEQLVTGTSKSLSGVVTRATMCIVALTLPIIVVVLLLGQPVLMVFGHGFTAAYPVLAIMCVGHFVNAMCGSVGLIMNLSGLEWKATRILAVSALANLMLHAVLITTFGVLGAAMATTISLCLWNIWMLMVVRREVGVDPSIRSVTQVLFGKALPTPS